MGHIFGAAVREHEEPDKKELCYVANSQLDREEKW